MSGAFASAINRAAVRDRVGVGHRRRPRRADQRRFDEASLAEDVPWRLHRHRSGPAGHHAGEQVGHHRARRGGMVDALSGPGQAAQRRQLVGQLVQLAASPSDQVRHDVAGDAEDGRVAGVGGAERRARVQQPRARHHRIGAGTPGRLGIAVGHVACALFVSGMDEPERAALFVDGVVEVVHVRAWYAEQGVYPVGHQRSRDLLPGRFQ